MTHLLAAGRHHARDHTAKGHSYHTDSFSLLLPTATTLVSTSVDQEVGFMLVKLPVVDAQCDISDDFCLASSPDEGILADSRGNDKEIRCRTVAGPALSLSNPNACLQGLDAMKRLQVCCSFAHSSNLKGDNLCAGAPRIRLLNVQGLTCFGTVGWLSMRVGSFFAPSCEWIHLPLNT